MYQVKDTQDTTQGAIDAAVEATVTMLKEVEQLYMDALPLRAEALSRQATLLLAEARVLAQRATDPEEEGQEAFAELRDIACEVNALALQARELQKAYTQRIG